MEALQAALSSSLGANSSPAVLQLLSQLQSAVEPLDVHICSPGGVGSTTLNNFLVRHGFRTNLLVDTDGLRHSPVPPSWSVPGQPDTPHPSKPRTVVYLYGDPHEVVASHYRRGHAYHQAIKTHRHPASIGPAESFPSTVEEYFDRGEDLFGLQAQFRAWTLGADAYDILIVRYENMFDPEVAQHLFQHLCGHKCDPVRVAQLAQEWVGLRHPRQSQVPQALRQAGMYSALLSDMAALPALCVVPARRQATAHQAAHQQAMDDLARLMMPHR